MREPLVQTLIRWGLLGALFGAGWLQGAGASSGRRRPTSSTSGQAPGSRRPIRTTSTRSGTAGRAERSRSRSGRHPGFAPAPLMPARTAPVIRRVWVADQTLPDGSWLQGTWWFMEVEPSHWLYEIDPGAAPFAEPELAPRARTRAAPKRKAKRG